MTSEFSPDLVGYGDRPGLGLWEDGHYRQHRNYAAALGTQGIVIPDYPILHLVGLDSRQFADWLNLHETLHAMLRGYAGVTGADLSELDPYSPEAWENWQLVHGYEHQAFDSVFKPPQGG